VAVAVTSDEEAEAMVHGLRARGYVVRAVVEHEAKRRLATARLVSATPPEVLIDLLFASSGIEEEVVSGAERLEILPGFAASVATVGHLLALKILARDDASAPKIWTTSEPCSAKQRQPISRPPGRHFARSRHGASREIAPSSTSSRRSSPIQATAAVRAERPAEAA